MREDDAKDTDGAGDALPCCADGLLAAFAGGGVGAELHQEATKEVADSTGDADDCFGGELGGDADADDGRGPRGARDGALEGADAEKATVVVVMLAEGDFAGAGGFVARVFDLDCLAGEVAGNGGDVGGADNWSVADAEDFVADF